MIELSMDFSIVAAGKMRDLANSTDRALRMLAINLDLPMEDAESVDFLRTALNETSKQMRVQLYRERADRISQEQTP